MSFIWPVLKVNVNLERWKKMKIQGRKKHGKSSYEIKRHLEKELYYGGDPIILTNFVATKIHTYTYTYTCINHHNSHILIEMVW